MAIAEDIQSLDPGARLELFELDLTQITRNTSDRYYFHAGTNGLGTDVVWQSKTYQRFPVEASGFEMSTKGTLPRPSLKVANVTGIMTALAAATDDLVGAKVTRRRTLARYLDAANFPAKVNTIRFSQRFNRWTTSGAVAVANAATAPDGTMTADKLNELAVSGVTHNLSSGTDTSAAGAGEIWTYSIHLKPAERRYAMVRLLTSTALSTTAYVSVDLVNLAFTMTSGILAGSGGITSLGDGWVRVKFSVTTTGSGALAPSIFPLVDPTNNTYLGVVGSGIYVWGAQAEKGAYMTKYQPMEAVYSANPSADPTQSLPDDIYYVERKVTQNRNFIEFELASAMDLLGQKLPNRVITTNVCQWEYRRWIASTSSFQVGTCPYAGSSYFDSQGVATTDPSKDVCSKLLPSGCKKRYPLTTSVLPFGGFPGSKAYKF
jgi:lambda family phage minor tail protein L